MEIELCCFSRRSLLVLVTIHFLVKHQLQPRKLNVGCCWYLWSTDVSNSGSIEASTVVFASAILTLPRSRPRQRARAAEVRGPGQMREGAVAPSPILGGRREWHWSLSPHWQTVRLTPYPKQLRTQNGFWFYLNICLTAQCSRGCPTNSFGFLSILQLQY